MIPLMVVPADPGDDALLDRIVTHLEGGGLLGYPTETVYGLGAAADLAGVEGVRALKGREEDRPFLVLLPTVGAGHGLRWPPAAEALAAAFWPGPLTLVLPDPEARFPPGVRSGRGGVALRVSPHPFVGGLLDRWGRPLLSTSANWPGEAPARTAGEVARAVEGRPGLHRLWIADGGPLVSSPPSTVVDCTGDRPRVVRAGALTVQTLLEIVPDLDD